METAATDHDCLGASGLAPAPHSTNNAWTLLWLNLPPPRLWMLLWMQELLQFWQEAGALAGGTPLQHAVWSQAVEQSMASPPSLLTGEAASASDGQPPPSFVAFVKRMQKTAAVTAGRRRVALDQDLADNLLGRWFGKHSRCRVALAIRCLDGKDAEAFGQAVAAALDAPLGASEEEDQTAMRAWHARWRGEVACFALLQQDVRSGVPLAWHVTHLACRVDDDTPPGATKGEKLHTLQSLQALLCDLHAAVAVAGGQLWLHPWRVPETIDCIVAAACGEYPRLAVMDAWPVVVTRLTRAVAGLPRLALHSHASVGAEPPGTGAPPLPSAPMAQPFDAFPGICAYRCSLDSGVDAAEQEEIEEQGARDRLVDDGVHHAPQRRRIHPGEDDGGTAERTQEEEDGGPEDDEKGQPAKPEATGQFGREKEEAGQAQTAHGCASGQPSLSLLDTPQAHWRWVLHDAATTRTDTTARCPPCSPATAATALQTALSRGVSLPPCLLELQCMCRHNPHGLGASCLRFLANAAQVAPACLGAAMLNALHAMALEAEEGEGGAKLQDSMHTLQAALLCAEAQCGMPCRFALSESWGEAAGATSMRHAVQQWSAMLARIADRPRGHIFVRVAVPGGLLRQPWRHSVRWWHTLHTATAMAATPCVCVALEFQLSAAAVEESASAQTQEHKEQEGPGRGHLLLVMRPSHVAAGDAFAASSPVGTPSPEHVVGSGRSNASSGGGSGGGCSTPSWLGPLSPAPTGGECTFQGEALDATWQSCAVRDVCDSGDDPGLAGPPWRAVRVEEQQVWSRKLQRILQGSEDAAGGADTTRAGTQEPLLQSVELQAIYVSIRGNDDGPHWAGTSPHEAALSGSDWDAALRMADEAAEGLDVFAGATTPGWYTATLDDSPGVSGDPNGT